MISGAAAAALFMRWRFRGAGVYDNCMQQALEAEARALDAAGVAQEARIVVQRQDQAVDLEHHLLGVGVAAAGGLRRWPAGSSA